MVACSICISLLGPPKPGPARTADYDQTTPAALPISDAAPVPAAFAFVDLDLDQNELGGDVTWQLPTGPAAGLVQERGWMMAVVASSRHWLLPLHHNLPEPPGAIAI